jgi:hypothetical protein
MGILRPLLSAGTGIIQGLGEYAQSRYNTDQTIRANKEMAEYQYNKDLEMWNKANEYNTPEAQMARLQAAGLNPNMVYGSGSVAGNTTGQLPKYQAPRIDYKYDVGFDLPSILNQFVDLQAKQTSIDNTKAQTDLINQRAITEGFNQKSRMTDTERKAFDLEMARNLQQYTMTKGITESKLATQRLGLMEYQTETEKLKQHKLIQDTIYREKMNEWLKMGITGSDHPLVRMTARVFTELGWDQGDIIDYFKNLRRK